MSQPTRPVMRYHGGKWRLAPWIISHFPTHRIYVEPFGGGASVLLRKPRSFAEVYNDLDGDVVNVFRVLRDPTQAEQLERACHLTPWSRTEFWGAYEPTDDPVEQARRTILRTFMAHGGTSRRKNRTGFRAVGYSRTRCASMDWAGWPELVPAFTERLRGVVIEQRPALEVIAQQDREGTLFYCDPPYPTSTRSAIRWPSENDRAYAHNLAEDDHAELAEVLHRIRGAAVVSSYPSELYDGLYGDWQMVEKEALGDGAVKRTEVLWLNPKAQKGGQGRLFA